VHSKRVGWRLERTIPPAAKLSPPLSLSTDAAKVVGTAFLFLGPNEVLLASCTSSSSRDRPMRYLALAAELAFDIFMVSRNL
jgi:hypothetical protein